MKASFSLACLMVAAVVVVPAMNSLADFEGRIGKLVEAALASTRVEGAVSGQSPFRFSGSVGPGGVISPCSFVLTPAIPIVTNTPIAGFVINSVPKGPKNDIHEVAVMPLNFALPAIAAIPIHALLMPLAPSEPVRPIPTPARSSVRLTPSTIAVMPTVNLPVCKIARGPARASFVPSEIKSCRPPVVKISRRSWAHVAAPPLKEEFAVLAAARLVRASLADGTLNPRMPAWRPHIVVLLAKALNTPDEDELFTTLLGSFSGRDARVRLDAVVAWAGGYEDGRYAEIIAYCAAHHAFTTGDCAATVVRCERIISEYPAICDRALLLLALAQAQSAERSKALKTLKDLRKRYPDSPAAPEARFMEAWIALQDSRNEDAVAILREIVAETPRAPAAAKATQMLASLAGHK